MLDIRFIRENSELVQKKAEQKGYQVDINRLLGLDKQWRDLNHAKESELHARRDQAQTIAQGGGPSDPDHLRKGREIKEKLARIDSQLGPIGQELAGQLAEVPNIFPDDTPIGGEEASREEKKWGETGNKNFKVLDHLEWGEKRGLIDFERGAKVAASKFYFLKGPLVELELAVSQLGLALAKQHGFEPMSVPHLVNTRTLEGAGFSARGEEKQIYKVEDEDLNLIATAEIPLTGYHADEILDEAKLPLLYAGLSPAYRVEGGAYGKHNRGLFRTHQFNKLELYVYCKPEDSENWHQKLLAMEEEFCQTLGLPYRVVRIAAGDLGAPAYKKYDIEYYTPVDGAYRELMSCSNVTDYQTRRLNTRYKDASGQSVYPHTLNATAAAMSRIIVALIENHQRQDGSIAVPQGLRPYLASREIF